VADTLHLLSKEQMQGRLLDELWKVHFIDGNVSRSIEALLANEDAGLIRLVCKSAKGVHARGGSRVTEAGKDPDRLPNASGRHWSTAGANTRGKAPEIGAGHDGRNDRWGFD